MKTVIAASALLCIVGTSGFACSPAQRSSLSASIADLLQEVVAVDRAHLGTAMSIMTVAAVKEYHAGPDAPGCARQIGILKALTEFSDSLKARNTALLKDA